MDFRQVFDGSPNLYMVLDRELRYVEANPAYCAAVGASRAELIGHGVFEMFPHDPEDPANVNARMLRESLDRVLATGKPDVLAYIPYRVARAPGAPPELRIWSATHTPLCDPGGRVEHILQHTVDVTELRQLQEAVAGPAAGVLGRAQQVQEAFTVAEAAQRHLRTLFEQAPGFVAVLRGPDHVFELANEAYLRLVGRRDIVGRPVRAALPEAASQGFVELLDRVRASGQTYVGRDVRVLLGGDEHFLDFVYQPLHGEDGAVSGIFVQGNDVTEVRRLAARERSARAEAEAAAREQRFLAESIPQQVWTARVDGAIDFVNDRVVSYFQVPRDQLLGDGWLAVIHDEDRERVRERWRRTLASGEIYEVDFRLRRGDGEHRWHLGRAEALRAPDGTIAKWFGTNTDIDDGRKARDALEARAEYEQQLIGIVSHDLRNPLNAISIASQVLLRRGQLDEQQGKAIARIVTSTERAARLIRDLLDFAQARSGTFPIAPGPANLRALAQHVVDEIHLGFPERVVEVVHRGEETGRWDADRVAQLVGNLVGNALQHSPPDAPIRVRTEIAGERAEIAVQNGGPPIPEETRARLFAPFQRGSRASTNSGRSVGLGLYIAQRIAQAHGGAIEVRSAADAGTTFRVTLPRHVA